MADVPDRSLSFFRVMRAVVALNMLVSMYTAGIIGVPVVVFAGPYFAMAGWMARADTPTEPHLAYPWLLTAIFAALPVPLIRRREWQIASLAAVPFAVLPFYQLYQLYIAATPTMWE